MPRVIVVLFWCWLAVSLLILARRGMRRLSGGGVRPSTPSTARPARDWPPLHEIDPVPADTPDPSDGGAAPAPRAGPSDTYRGPRSRPQTLAEALSGIRMPCDLAPLTGTGEASPRHVAFYTVGYPPEAVAPEIADELERIGMEFNSLSENTAIARRDDVEVRVAVHAVGSALNGVADLTFPTAPEHSVVVEFELT